MANYPKKIKDPTEAALSAIQEALNLRDEDEAAGQAEPMADLLADAASPGEQVGVRDTTGLDEIGRASCRERVYGLV